MSSFSGWFGSANPSRVNALVTEFRARIAGERPPGQLANFDMESPAQPYPTSFDLRSARTRCLLNVVLAMGPRDADGSVIPEPWRDLAGRGPAAVGYIILNASKQYRGNPANRMLRPPGVPSGGLRPWIDS